MGIFEEHRHYEYNCFNILLPLGKKPIENETNKNLYLPKENKNQNEANKNLNLPKENKNQNETNSNLNNYKIENSFRYQAIKNQENSTIDPSNKIKEKDNIISI